MAFNSRVMMVNKEQALAIAANRLRDAGREKWYDFAGCSFLNERTGTYPTPARWIVRYLKKPLSDGSVIDDGDQLFVVRIEAESGQVKVSCGF